MPDLPLIHHAQMLRAVLGTRPVILAKKVDTVTLDHFAQRLAQPKETIQLMRANGCGTSADSLPGMVWVELARN